MGKKTRAELVEMLRASGNATLAQRVERDNELTRLSTQLAVLRTQAGLGWQEFGRRSGMAMTQQSDVENAGDEQLTLAQVLSYVAATGEDLPPTVVTIPGSAAQLEVRSIGRGLASRKDDGLDHARVTELIRQNVTDVDPDSEDWYDALAWCAERLIAMGYDQVELQAGATAAQLFGLIDERDKRKFLKAAIAYDQSRATETSGS